MDGVFQSALKENDVGLTPELLRELDLPQFEDSETARRYLETQAWPDGPVCAHCGQQERIYELKGLSTRPGLFSCGGCRGRTTVTTKTVFHNTKLGLHKWLQITAAVEKASCTLEELGEAVGVTYVTAWRIRKLIRPDLGYGGRKPGGATGRGRRKPEPAERRVSLCYPFMESKRQLPEHELLRLINRAVPQNIPEDRRADMCQEIALSILIGDLDVADIGNAWKGAFSKVYQMHPTKWAPLSLDAPIGDTDLTIMDTLSTEDSIWNRI